MIKAIIFDCFGVLVTENWFKFKETYFGDDPDRARQAAELMDQANAGVLNVTQLVDELATLAHVDATEVRRYLDGNARDEQLLQYIAEELKPHYKIGMLSNASTNWLKSMLSDEQRALFDAIDLSYESGVAKPNELAYLNIADKLMVTPEECVFIDDQERHCSGAKDTGMHAIEYKDFTALKADIQNLLRAEQ
jgi:HAD superfamily hydrolase (TIGR01509 family)